MAVLGRLLVSSAERLDLPDFLSVDSYTQGDFKYLMKSFVGSDKPYVLAGFDIINPGAAIGTQNVSIRVYDSVVYFPQSLAGPFFHGLEEGNTLSAPLVPELRKNSTNYIYLTLDTTEAAKDTRAFWDPDKEGGDGGEFTQDINTQSALIAAVNVSTSSFPEDTVPVAIVEVGPNFITSIEDARDMMFRLGTGGLSPDPLSTYAFREDPDATNARLEPNTLMTNALDPNAFQGGDKNILSLKEWMDVVMTKLKELGGTTYWYEDTSTFGLVNIFKDSLASSIKSKGNWQSSDATAGLLTWSEGILIQSVSDNQDIIIRDGNKTLTDNQTLYIPLERKEDINTGGISVNWFNALNKVNGSLGAFENLTKGDWIKKSDDPDYRYLRVEEFYAGLDLSGGVTAPGNALSIKLSDVYGGISELKRGVYNKGVYLSSDVLVADRDDPALTAVGGDLYWLAMRSDTVMSVADLTTTTLAIDITNHDGLTAKVTSTAHGLTDGQRIGISGTTNYDGTHAVEVEDVDTFYINVTGGPFADELTQSAYFTTVTTQIRSTVDGLQLESAEHGFNIDQTILVSDTTNYDGSFKVFPTGNTTFTIPVNTAIANETAGSATAVTMYVRTDIGPTKLEQGADKAIGTVDMENLMSFVGMDNMSQTYPTYNIPPDYNTIDGFVNYNSEITDNMTERVSKLTAMMADKAQDKTIVLAPSGYTTVTNALNGAARDISFNPAPSETPRLDIVLPSSDQNNSLVLTGTISLLVNQAAYIEIDRNDPQNLANLAAVTVSNITSIPLSENVMILAVRLGTDEVWLWDGFYVSGGITPIPSFIAQLVVQDRNAKLIEGGTWSFATTSTPINFAVNTTPGIDLTGSSNTSTWRGQTFTTSGAGNITDISFSMRRTVVPSGGNLVVDLYSDAAGSPGVLLATSDPVLATSVTGSSTDIGFTFSTPVAVNGSTVYHAIVNTTSVTGTFTFLFEGTASSTYVGGNLTGTTNSGASWSPSASFDLIFSIDGDNGAAGLTLSADAHIQVADLTKERNTIQAQTIGILNDDEVAYVEINRSAGGATNLTVNVADETAVSATLNTFIIARRLGGDIILGTGTERLLDGQSMMLDQTSSDQTLTYIGANNTADSDPDLSASPQRTVTDAQSLTASVVSIDTEIDKFFGQLRMTADGSSDRVIMTGADRTMLDTGVIGQELASLLLKFEGAQIDFGTGEIFESDGTTPLGQDFTPVTIAAGEFRWYSVSMIPNALDADGRITAQLLVLPGDSDGATAALATRAVFGGTKKIGQVVVEDNGAGGSGTINNINQADIIQLGVGAGGGGASAPKMIGGGTFEWGNSLTLADAVVATNVVHDSSVSIGAGGELGQTFTPTATGTLKEIKMYYSNTGGATVGNVFLNVYATTAGLPTGAPLKVSLNQIAVNTIGADQELTFTFDNLQSLTLGTQYAWAVQGDVAFQGAGQSLRISEDSGNNYAGGNEFFTATAGSGWAALASDDARFTVTTEALTTVSNALSFTEDIFIEQPRLDYVDNTIDQATYSPIILPTTDDVAFIERLNASSGGPNLTITIDDITNVKDGQIIIARRDGDDVIVGSTSNRLLDGESKKLFAGVSDQILNVIPATDNADDSGQARLKAQATPSTTVDVTSVTKTVPDGTEYGIQLKNLLLDFTGATIDFATGTVSTGINFTPVTIAANQYRWHSVTLLPGTVGVDGKIAGQLLILPANADGASAAAAIRAPWANGIPLGQVVVQDDGAGGAGTVLVINQSDIVQLSTSGGAGGEGNADEIIEALRNQLDLNNFRYVGYNVFRIDEDDKVDGASTGSYDIANGVYDLESTLAPPVTPIQTTTAVTQLSGSTPTFYSAQTFTTTVGFNLSQITLELDGRASTGFVHIEIWGVNGSGIPDSSNVIATSTSRDITTFAVQAAPLTAPEIFVFPGTETLTTATQYAAVLIGAGITGGGNIVVMGGSAVGDVYAGGKSWTANSPYGIGDWVDQTPRDGNIIVQGTPLGSSENMTSIQMLDEMFLTPSAFPETADEDVVDVPEVELTVFWEDTLVDDAAVYEVSRDAGNEYQVIDMTRVGTTNAYRGKYTFVEEAVSQTLVDYTAGSLAVTDFEGLAANALISNATAFTLTDTAIVNNFKFHYDKLGSPLGKFKVSIVRDDTALPSTDPADVLSESTLQDIVALASGSNIVSVEMPSTALEPGTYHIVISTDLDYKNSYSNGVDELRVEVDSAGGSVDISQLDGTTGVWAALVGVSMRYELEGRALDLRVKITASQDSSLAGYGVFYNGTSGLVSGILNKEIFAFDGITDNDFEFTLTQFLPDPDLLKVYERGTGQVYTSGDFTLDGHKVTFPVDTFNKVGTVTLKFDQTHGTSFDNADINGALLAANRLGSTDPALDRSVSGEGILLRADNGTLVEASLKWNGVAYEWVFGEIL